MGYKNTNDEVIINIENDINNVATEIRTDPVFSKKKFLSKLFSGVLGFSESPNDGDINEKVELLVDKSNAGQQDQELLPLVANDEKLKAGKPKKAPKPPRPPRGPSLDAADMRMIREIAKIAAKKRERIERAKALKRVNAAKSLSQTSQTPSSSSTTLAAMVITILFFLVIIIQGLCGSSTSSNMAMGGAPQPAPRTTGLISVQLHHSTPSNPPMYASPKSTGAEFSSEG